MAGETAMIGFAVGWMIAWIVMAIVSLIAIIWAIIDIVKAKKDSTWKAIWILVCVLLGLIGVIIYYFVGRKK